MRHNYKATIIDRYSAEERSEYFEAINEEHARRIAGSRCDVCEYVAAVEIDQPAEEAHHYYRFEDAAGSVSISAENEATAREILRELGHNPGALIATSDPELVNVDELAKDLDTGEHGDALNDYRDSSAYISDAIHEAADQRTSIYYSDIMAFIAEHPDALADVVAEGLYDPSQNYDLFQHGQAAEYMVIYNDIWNHLEAALMIAAVDFLRYDLKRQYIPAELAEYLETWVTDPGDRMDEIPDRIRDYFGDMEGGADE